LANEHATLRQMLGVGDWQAHVQFELQTLKDNFYACSPRNSSTELTRRSCAPAIKR
jgi:hypothetical protein